MPTLADSCIQAILDRIDPDVSERQAPRGNPELQILGLTAFAQRLSEGKWTAAPHHDYLGGWLEDAEQGKRVRIVIEEPPRHGKSEQASYWFPVWYLNRHPERRIILCSYEAGFAAEWGRKVRNTIEEHSEELNVQVAQRSHAANRWDTTAGGGMRTAGVGGAITGRGADLLIIDDPFKNRDQAESSLFREKAWQWLMSTAMSRLEPGGVVIIIQTRWHQDDLAGRVLDQSRQGVEHWDELRLPAIAEKADPLGREPGEPLWPERYDVAALEQIKVRDEDTWWALYQQRPTVPGGSIFLQEWWADGRQRYYLHRAGHEVSVGARWLMLDTAMKDNEGNDYSACSLFELLTDYRLAVRPLWNEKLQFPELVSQVQATATSWNAQGKLRGVVIEDKSSGTSVIQTLRASAPKWLATKLVAFMPSGSKVYRGRQASVWCKNGRVLLPHPDYEVPVLADLEDQLYNVPSVAHDDLFDTFTMGIIYLENFLAAGFQAVQGVTESATVAA